jgi:hypothetical protein
MAFTPPFGYQGDGIRYISYFEKISTIDNNDFHLLMQRYFQFDDGDKDIYIKIIYFLVSRISGNYHLLFCVLAAIFAFFMLKSLYFLTTEKKFNSSFVSYLLVFTFIFSNSVFNINGARFWTASWIGIYTIFQIFKNGNKKYFLLACITPLVHVSFYVFVIILLISYMTHKYNKFWISMLFASFVLSNISADMVQSLSDHIPDFLYRTTSAYSNTDYIEQRQEETALYYKVIFFLQQVILNVIVLFFIRNKQVIFSSSLNTIYSFLIIWMSFVNFTIPVPSLGGRFMILSLPIIAYIWLIAFKQTKQYNPILYLFLIIFSYNFFQQIRGFFKVTEIEFIISNPFYLIKHYLFL